MTSSTSSTTEMMFSPACFLTLRRMTWRLPAPSPEVSASETGTNEPSSASRWSTSSRAYDWRSLYPNTTSATSRT